MDWREMIESSVNEAGAEAQAWEIAFNGDSATLALEAAVNFVFRNSAHTITPTTLGKAYLDASTDFPSSTPRSLGKVIYVYASRLASGHHD